MLIVEEHIETVVKDTSNTPTCLYCNNKAEEPITLQQEPSKVQVTMCSDYCAKTLEECDQNFIRL